MKFSWHNFLFILIVCLFLPSYSSGEESFYSLEQLRRDYKQVSVVAHVRIQDTKVADDFGGHFIYIVYCKVVEPFKGNLKSGEILEYYVWAEKGYKYWLERGDRIVFLERNFDERKKRWVLTALENSTRDYSEGIIFKMRKIKALEK